MVEIGGVVGSDGVASTTNSCRLGCALTNLSFLMNLHILVKLLRWQKPFSLPPCSFLMDGFFSSHFLWECQCPWWQLSTHTLVKATLCKISSIFQTTYIFWALNPIFPPKFNRNWFSIEWLTCSNAGLHIIPCGSKVMADCHRLNTQPPAFLAGFHSLR